MLSKGGQGKAGKRVPLWNGPEKDGVTYSLLVRFLACRERFRILVVEGLRPADSFNPRIEFGQMWHAMEEAHAGWEPGRAVTGWPESLGKYAQDLYRRYPTQREAVEDWYGIARVMFPLYVQHWRKHEDAKHRTPILQEQTFSVPYRLPSGRTVKLRGKWDSVDLVGKGKDAGIYLQENKTKGDIDEQQIKRQLSFDLQTMLYLVALGHNSSSQFLMDSARFQLVDLKGKPTVEIPIKGVRYNVIRRPRQYQGKKETRDDFLTRLKGIVEEDPGHFFMRWRVEIMPGDVAKFRRECLDPILEQLCDWWSWIEAVGKSRPDSGVSVFGSDDGCENSLDQSVRGSIHWRHPFGVYNVLDEGGISDLDEYLASGSTRGLARATTLFPELEGT